jgi:hypothetical protein
MKFLLEQIISRSRTMSELQTLMKIVGANKILSFTITRKQPPELGLNTTP